MVQQIAEKIHVAFQEEACEDIREHDSKKTT